MVRRSGRAVVRDIQIVRHRSQLPASRKLLRARATVVDEEVHQIVADGRNTAEASAVRDGIAHGSSGLSTISASSAFGPFDIRWILSAR